MDDVGDEQKKAQPMSDAERLKPWHRLHSPEVEKIIVQAAINLKEILVPAKPTAYGRATLTG